MDVRPVDPATARRFARRVRGRSAGQQHRPAASAEPSHDHSPAPSGSPAPADHDSEALAVVTRFLDGEYDKVEGAGNQPKEPTLDGDVKVFEFTVDEIQHKVDAVKDPVAALGFDAMWPGPRLDVVEGDKIRAIFKNNLQESTGIHFHGQRLPNNMDGVPLITQDPIHPGDSFTYEFTARTTGSHMYHSHHNATDQVGRGLLGRVHRPAEGPGEALRPALRRHARTSSGSATTRWAASRSTAGASRRRRRSSRPSARRSRSGS